jgi:hypothetical protein
LFSDQKKNTDNSIQWANRSRSFEKHIRTDNVGIQQFFSLLLGKKIKDEAPSLDNAEDLPSGDEKKAIESGEKGSPGPSAVGAHGISESEWEQAQRATRTATVSTTQNTFSAREVLTM